MSSIAIFGPNSVKQKLIMQKFSTSIFLDYYHLSTDKLEIYVCNISLFFPTFVSFTVTGYYIVDKTLNSFSVFILLYTLAKILLFYFFYFYFLCAGITSICRFTLSLYVQYKSIEFNSSKTRIIWFWWGFFWLKLIL